jgi:hypothetical protein
MGTLPIFDKSTNRQTDLSSGSLPAFYMEDYSILGLRVDRLNESLRILDKQKFEIITAPDRFEIVIDNAGQIPDIVDLLDRNGIVSDLSDVIEQVYQG